MKEFDAVTAEVRTRLANQFSALTLAATMLSLAGPLAALVAVGVLGRGGRVTAGPIELGPEDMYLLLIPAVPLWGLALAGLENELMISRLGAYTNAVLKPRAERLLGREHLLGWESFYAQERRGTFPSSLLSHITGIGRYSLTALPASVLLLVYAVARPGVPRGYGVAEVALLIANVMFIAAMIVVSAQIVKTVRRLR